MTSKHETKVFSIHTEGDHRFGFTLAGQYPCHLVKIQEDSPAYQTGLKSGDEIIEVNGVNVEDLKHDCVASFIAPCENGRTELRIRRTTQTPSSPQTVKISGHSVHKSVSEDLTCNSSKAYLSDVVDRVVEEFKRPTESEKQQQKGQDPVLPYCSPAAHNDLMSNEQLSAGDAKNTAANLSTPLKLGKKRREMAQQDCKIEAIVGYLGSIDRPIATKTSDFILSHVRTKTTPLSSVLLEVSPCMLCVKDSNKQVLLTCATESLQYIGICPENKQILGLFTENQIADGVGTGGSKVTRSVSAITSDVMVNCSCHLFVIDPRLIRHLNHKPVIDQFQLLCIPDPNTGSCQQFPTSSRSFLNSLSAVLRESLEIRKAELPDHATSVSSDGIPSDDQRSSVSESANCCQRSDGINNHLIANESQDECNGAEEGLVLCLHLYSLVHYGSDKDSEIMNYRSQEDYNLENGEYMNTHGKTACEVTASTSSDILTTSSQRPASVQKSQQNEESGEAKKEGRRHKTLAHRRSQSLAGNVTNLLQPCSIVTQALDQCRPQEYRIVNVLGNSVRPVFHSSSNILSCNNVNNVAGRVAKWALAFDKLLEDKIGLSIFRSFLQKEYSEENLIFWLTCEKYKTLTDKDELQKAAEEIYEMHLKSCATLPVNVESSAIRSVEEKLENPQSNLFTSLQYQVYTLMKFDSYARFLKSDLYRQCWVDELEGRPLLSIDDDETKKAEEGTGTLRRMFGSSTKAKGWNKTLTKSQTSSESDESKKKSFLPWRGRVKSEQGKRITTRSSDSQASSARSSLSSLSDSVFSATITNSEENLNNDSDSKDQAPPTCRVILPNRSLMYLFCKSTRTLKEGLAKLCEKKEYSLPTLDLFIGDNKLTKEDLQKKLTRYVNKEIVLKQGVLFRLEIAKEKSFGVKADSDKTISDVLGPILRESYLDIDNVIIRRSNNQQLLSKDCSVLSLHQHHVIVEKQSVESGRRASDSVVKTREKQMKVNNNDIKINIINNSNNNNTEDEKCNTKGNEDIVFDAIMCGKRQSINGFCFDVNGVFCPEIKETTSKECLTIKKEDKQQKMARSPALFRKKKREGVQTTSTFKTFVREDHKKETEELLTLLRRTQNARLDDQRGMLDKNVELPEFLKLPEKPPPNKRNTVLDVGVPSPRPQHQSLKKTTSFPQNCGPAHNPPQRSQSTRTHSSTIVERPIPPERGASVSRNWTGSLRIRGRTHVESVNRVVTETQTIDRRHFTKGSSRVSPKNRTRSESLQHERSGDFLASVETRSEDQHENQTTPQDKTDNVWVSTPTSINRRRASNRTRPQLENGGNERRTNNDDETPTNAEVIVPDTNVSASRFPITGAVVSFFDRPKPITDSTYFKEFLETAKLKMPTDEEPTKARDFDSTSDREAILDNSFLREQLKPSRLFSQLTPETSTSSSSPSPSSGRKQDDSKKCPLFIPPTLKLNSIEDDPARNTSKARKNRVVPTGTAEDTSRSSLGETGSKEEESLRVTFV